MFSINQKLLDSAQHRLKTRNNIYWIVGGSCSGKSTISQAIAEKSDVTRYDMDAGIYGTYAERYTLESHPANKAWLSASNPLAWQLDLSIEEFDAFNRAANVEYLDLFTTDPAISQSQHAILVDGGMIHPALLMHVIPRDHIFCIDTSRENRVNLWETSTERAQMKEWIYALPNPQVKWEKFLQCDEWITQTIVKECEANHIEFFRRDDQTSVADLAEKVAASLGIKLVEK